MNTQQKTKRICDGLKTAVKFRNKIRQDSLVYDIRVLRHVMDLNNCIASYLTEALRDALGDDYERLVLYTCTIGPTPWSTFLQNNLEPKYWELLTMGGFFRSETTEGPSYWVEVSDKWKDYLITNKLIKK